MFKRAATRSDVARARLRALAPGWVPTRESAERELAAVRARAHKTWPTSGEEVDDEVVAQTSRVTAKHVELERAPFRGFLLLLAGALAGAVAVVLVGWPRGDVAPVKASPIVGSTRGTAESLQEESGSFAGDEVMVDVAGLVKRPGVVTLPTGSRVLDAVEAAGGVLPRGNTSNLNLAQLLTDGQQVLVGGELASAPPTAGTAASETPGAVVSINSGTLEQLDTLPGIGPVLAQAIIDWRAENGGFTAIEQLQEVSGIGEATYADISGLVAL